MSQTKAQLIDNLVSPITGALGSAAAPTFSFTADPNTGLYSPGADQVAISTGGTGRLFIDSSGRLLVGTSTARSNFFGTTLSSLTQTEGTGGSTARGALSVINNDVSNNPPYVLLGRSGAATLGSNAVVVSGSRLGTLTFHGADGTSFIEAATVAGEVDGTPGTNDMPGRLVFSTTADGAASPTERMRIDSQGRVGIGTASPGDTLDVYGIISTRNAGGSEGGQVNFYNPDNTAIGLTVDVQSADVARIFSTRNNLNLQIGQLGGTGGNIGLFTAGSERARIDSSGRLLVGTSSSSVACSAVFQGNSTNSGGSAIVHIQRGSSSVGLAADTVIGRLMYGDNAGNPYAYIDCTSDAAAGTSDYPGRLVFSTTADGAASPTERIRITSAGLVGIGTTSPQKKLVASNGGAEGIEFSPGDAANKNVVLNYNRSTSAYITAQHLADIHIWGGYGGTGGNEAMRIDGSGRLLVGTSTASSLNSSSLEIYQSGIDNTDLGKNALLLRKNEFTAGNQTSTLFRIQSGTSTQSQLAAGLFTDSGGASGSFFDQVSGSIGLTFRTGGTERMRITSSGNVFIGTTTAGGGGWTTANAGAQIVQYSATSDTRSLYEWKSDNAGSNTTAVYIESTGKIYARTTTVQAISSERRLKENIVPLDIDDAWETIKSVPFYSYNFIGADPSNVLYGPMADEVPDAMRVATSQSDDVGVIHTYDNGMLQARLYVALQTALNKIETLEAKVAALESA
jgi:hypothetical protein